MFLMYGTRHSASAADCLPQVPGTKALWGALVLFGLCSGGSHRVLQPGPEGFYRGSVIRVLRSVSGPTYPQWSGFRVFGLGCSV